MCSQSWCASAVINAVRLVGGPNNLEGRLEVQLGPLGWWGTVCDDRFASNSNAAQVVCRMLGKSGGVVVSNVQTKYGESTSLGIFLDETRCTGAESSLNQCNFSLTHDCGRIEDVGVACMNGELSMFERAVSFLSVLYRGWMVFWRHRQLWMGTIVSAGTSAGGLVAIQHAANRILNVYILNPACC